MGYIFEELIRKFTELSNETAGEHFTPREVIRLMVNLLFLNDRDILSKKGVVKTVYDCACGTGGMLSIAEEYLNELNKYARLEVFGQELNEESYASVSLRCLLKGKSQITSNTVIASQKISCPMKNLITCSQILLLC
jgi:type I restriction enzyme M protein